MTDAKATVALNGEFSALELEEIIADLAQVRAGMQPAVPSKPDPDRNVPVQERTLFSIRNILGGGARIWLRNEGFGWLAFELSAEEAVGLAEFLRNKRGHTYTTH